MCWKQEYFYTKCGCRVVDEAVVLKKCPGAEAYGRPCIGSFENAVEDIRFRREVCPTCARAGDKKKKRSA